MPSPFPGMDPYLEKHWGDVHHRLVTYACDSLQGHLPSDLLARVEERVYVESPVGRERTIFPDVRVITGGARKRRTPRLNGAVGVAEPLIIQLPDEPVTEGYIEIIDVGSGKRVVTVIEVLSLANKTPGEGRNLYGAKQRELLEAKVSLVEIDLLRAGPWAMSFPENCVPTSHRSTYQVVVRRGWKLPAAEIYRVPLREPLPIIGVPLRPTDADVPLNLQALIEMCYRNGGYDQDLDYWVEPEPPLAPRDARWLDRLLRAKGLRPRRRARKKTKG